MHKPSPKALVEATGISQAYASMILSEDPAKGRTPPRSLAIRIFRETSWKHPIIADLSEADMETLERIDPWQPREKSQPQDVAA
jgi:hypothetical protein